MPLTSSATAVTCRVDCQLLALRTSDVAEVLPMVELSTVPEMPRLLHGFVAARGGMTPVVRLEAMLGASSAEPVPLTPAEALARSLILTRCGESMLGFVCESPGLLGYAPDDLIRLPEGHALNACCRWMIPQNEGPAIPLLEPTHLLFEAERLKAQQLAARVEARLSAISPP